jgi:DNA-binding transcriptional LysR family regulator
MKLAGIKLERLAAFAAVARAGSFTAAADRAHVTKSALSQAVTLLERELGAQLLQRSTRSLALTEFGMQFLGECEALLTQAEQMVEHARTSRAQPTGTLKLTSTADMAPLVAQWIALYCERFAQMRVDYVPSDARLDLIAEGFDLGLRIGLLRDSQLRAVKLMDIELLMAASPAYLARHGTPKTPQALAKHAWIGYSVIPAPWAAPLQSRGGKRHTVRMRGAVSVSTSSGLRALALAGNGIAALPSTSVQADLDAGRLVQVMPNYQLPPLVFYLLYPGTLTPPAKTRAFIDLVKEQVGRLQ